MTITEKMKALLADQTAIVNMARAESRSLTDEETQKFDALDAEIKNLEATQKKIELVDARKVEDAKPADKVIWAEPKSDKPVWTNMGEFFLAVKNAGTPGMSVDPRLAVKNAASGLNEGVPSEGGFFVQQDFSATLMRNVYDTGILASRCRSIPISANSNSLKMLTVDETSRANGSRLGGVVSYWQGEADSIVSSKPKFGALELTLKKMTALCYMTDELSQDASAMESIITQSFTEEMAFRLDDAIVRGTGAGMPLGILESPALITVSKTSSQTADTVTLNNCMDMWARTWPRSRANMVWLTNQEVEPQLQKMTIATGTYSGATVYMPPGGISGASYSTLFGRPVLVVEQAAALGDAGDLILADFSQYLLITKGGIQAAQSIHVRFLYDENVFRFILRVDGQPMWKSPLTPYKGASTISPFVTLAARA